MAILRDTCSRCGKKFSERPIEIRRTRGRTVFILGELCRDCSVELLKWILKGTDEDTIQKMQDLEQAQLDKAYEIGYQVGYEEGKLCEEKEEV